MVRGFLNIMNIYEWLSKEIKRLYIRRKTKPTYYQRFRAHEINMIFKKHPPEIYNLGLEIGAGSGFMSSLLTKYVKKLYCTGLNPIILEKKSTENIIYKIVDAENIIEEFNDKKFDFIFSCNLLEHISDIDKTLNGIKTILKEDGISVHCMPNKFWKFCHLFLFLPSKIILLIKLLIKSPIKSLITKKTLKIKDIKEIFDEEDNNNIKIKRKNQFSFINIFIPKEPHGVSSSHKEEFDKFGKEYWVKNFQKADLKVLKILKGPVSFGYMLGFAYIDRLLEKIGISSEYVYIVTHNENLTKYQKYF